MKPIPLCFQRRRNLVRVAWAAGLLLFGASLLPAQSLSSLYETEPVSLDSGIQDNSGAAEILPFTRVVQASVGTPVMRLHFSGYNLGDRSYVRITSLHDQQSQQLDARSMAQWSDTSALFNGDQVSLELHVAPGDEGIYVRADLIVKRCNCGDFAGPMPETLCGSDNRVASTDNRVGRINGCTAWLISNGGVLTAGHCAPLAGVFEVNVPASNPDGSLNASAVSDQYPIITPADVSQNNNAGDDYTVFRLNPDNLGRRAHDRLGFFRLTRTVPADGTTMRVTGCGVDDTPPGTTGGGNAQNQTLQTSTGPYAGQTISSATRVWHNYAVDTMPANSGSPIIWEANGFAVGIHTHGGCNSDGSGANAGTSFNHSILASAIDDLPGVNTFYLDNVTYPGSPADTGNVFSPDHNLTTVYNHAPSGGKISVVAASYPRATAGNTGTFGTGYKSMTLVAPVGLVTLGN